jgi:hypothetical protein
MIIRKLNKGGKEMSGENNSLLSNFVHEDRFELNAYLTYLFNQFYYYDPNQLEEKMIK